jgi:cytochrome c
VALSPDGSILYTGSYDGTIRAWPLKSGSAAGGPSVVYSHGWGINVVAATPDGSALVFGALNGAGGIIDFAGNEVTSLEFGEHPILSLALSPDGRRFAAGSADGNIWVVNLKTAAIIEEYDNIHGPVWGLAFTPDGKTLYHAGLDDFVTHWQIDPRKIIEPVDTVFPRRFQVSEGADPGSVEFQRKCSVCHTLEPDGGNRAGPTLFDLFGRKAGSVDGYEYSPALANSGIIWNEKTVAELFADGPNVMVPGTKMPVQVLKSVDRRDALISFLRKASAPVNDNPNAKPRKR